MKEALQILDPLRLNFDEGGSTFLNFALALIMFGVALNIKREHVTDVARRPRSVVAGMLAQFVGLPVVTLLLTMLMNRWITPGVALGMILVASCPGGNISNFVSTLAKGNIALSVTLTAISSMLAIIMTPLNFSIYGNLYLDFFEMKSHLAQEISIDPMQMFQTVFIILAIPLAIGYMVELKMPRLSDKIKGPFKIFSLVVFAAIVAIAFKNNFDYIIHYAKYIMLIVLIHNAIALSTGYLIAKSFRMSKLNCRTISIETGIQNSGLALALIFNPKIFAPDLQIGGMAFIAAWWGIWHIVAGLGIAGWWGRRPIADDKQ